MSKRKIRVAFNVSCLYPKGVGGWSRYTQSLINALRSNFSDEVEIFEFWNSEGIGHSVWEQIHLPVLCSKNKIDILHAPANGGLPLVLNIPSVLTVHDLFSEESFSWFPLKSLSDFKSKIRYKYDWILSSKKAKSIIAVSQFTKKQLLDCGYKPSKLNVIYEAVENSIQKTEEEFKQHKRDSYLLYVGSDDGRKHVSDLIQQYSNIKNLDLVLVTNLRQSKPPDSRNVYVYNQIDDEGLSKLYSNAYSFVTFSEKEGFGLPILEAMRCGCPVIYNGTGAEKELVGSFGIYAANNLLQAVESLRDVHTRMNIKKSLQKRSDNFSWKKAAEETLNVYKSLLNL